MMQGGPASPESWLVLLNLTSAWERGDFSWVLVPGLEVHGPFFPTLLFKVVQIGSS